MYLNLVIMVFDRKFFLASSSVLLNNICKFELETSRPSYRLLLEYDKKNERKVRFYVLNSFVQCIKYMLNNKKTNSYVCYFRVMSLLNNIYWA